MVKAASRLVAEDGEVILFHVIPPGRTEMEAEERILAMAQLNRLSSELSEASIKSSCAVEVSESVANCIANYASQEGADLIAMYTHGRTGLAKLLKGSVTAYVKRRASVEVRAFGSSELAEIGVDLQMG